MTSATPAPAGQHQPELAGQTVVVIGGSSGMGLETARRARAEGAEVILAARNPDRLRAAAEELGARYSAAFDAGDPAAVAQFFRDLPGPIDHVMLTTGARARHRVGGHRGVGTVRGRPGAGGRAGARQPHRARLR